MVAKLKSISAIRWIRISIGLLFVFSGIGEKHYAVSLFGGLLLLQGIMDWGCGFSKNSCGPTIDNKMSVNTDFNPDKAFKKLNK